jgi:hypothetical protein
VGDCHQLYKQYFEIIRNADYSFQAGDLGFDYAPLNNLDFSRHRAIKGNHDNYLLGNDHPIFCGDFGVENIDNKQIFFMRGAWSIDKKYRTAGIDWWSEEELNYTQLSEAINLYKKIKPEIVITHECPLEIVQYVTNPNFVRGFGFTDPVIKTRTNMALQEMFEYHQPSVHLFGHYHVRKEIVVRGTKFICLDMIRDKISTNCYYDLA